VRRLRKVTRAKLESPDIQDAGSKGRGRVELDTKLKPRQKRAQTT
jgi:hypothetical protein